ncbi:MAG: 6-carboxytetrahydropterin synthase [Phycisphaerae bacterium]
MFFVEIQEQFNASHAVKIPGGQWEQSHRHQWKVRIFLTRRKLNKYFMVVDFHLAKRILRSVLDTVEGRDLNAIPAIGKSPTTELVAKYLFDQLSTLLTEAGVKVKSLALCETDDCWAWYSA